MNTFENYGIGALGNNEDLLNRFLTRALWNGESVESYYTHRPYFFSSFGDAELWIGTEYDTEDEPIRVKGFSVHCGGPRVWTMRQSAVDLTRKDDPPMTRTFVYGSPEGGTHSVPMRLINADILPGFMEGDVVRMQVIAQPVRISYYADHTEYECSLPADDSGVKHPLADGTLLPVGLMRRRTPAATGEPGSAAHILFKGVVKKLFPGKIHIGDIDEPAFYHCVIDTEYGEMDLNHSRDMVAPDQWKNIRRGAVVTGLCVLSADVAINEYERGIVRNHAHDLRLVQYTMQKGDPERLRAVLTEKSRYISQSSGRDLTGTEAIIAYVRYVREKGAPVTAHLATLIETDSSDPDLYPVGTRCIALKDHRGNFESIVFIECDEDGNIAKISLSTDKRYAFMRDDNRSPKKQPPRSPTPDSVTEPILFRAKFCRVISVSVTAEEIGSESDAAKREAAQSVTDALSERENSETSARNAFGYLFVKGIESALRKGEVCFEPENAVRGINDTSPEFRDRMEKYFDLGKQFYSDFKSFVKVKGIREEDVTPLLTDTLVILQTLGAHAAQRFF